MTTEPPTVPPFKITRQDERGRLDEGGVNHYDWTIYFTTPSGVSSQVNVPEEDHNPETVARLIIEKTQRIESIQRLGTTPAEGQ